MKAMKAGLVCVTIALVLLGSVPGYASSAPDDGWQITKAMDAQLLRPSKGAKWEAATVGSKVIPYNTQFRLAQYGWITLSRVALPLRLQCVNESSASVDIVALETDSHCKRLYANWFLAGLQNLMARVGDLRPSKKREPKLGETEALCHDPALAPWGGNDKHPKRLVWSRDEKALRYVVRLGAWSATLPQSSPAIQVLTIEIPPSAWMGLEGPSFFWSLEIEKPDGVISTILRVPFGTSQQGLGTRQRLLALAEDIVANQPMGAYLPEACKRPDVTKAIVAAELARLRGTIEMALSILVEKRDSLTLLSADTLCLDVVKNAISVSCGEK